MPKASTYCWPMVAVTSYLPSGSLIGRVWPSTGVAQPCSMPCTEPRGNGLYQQALGYGEVAGASGCTRSDQPLRQALLFIAMPRVLLRAFRVICSNPGRPLKLRIVPAGSVWSPVGERHTVVIGPS